MDDWQDDDWRRRRQSDEHDPEFEELSVEQLLFRSTEFDELSDEDMFLPDALDEPEIVLDVPFVPTDEKVVEAMLELAEVSANDLLYDLGCGDGRIVVAAAMERGARGVGIDLDPMRVAEAMEYAADSRVEHMVEFHEGDLLDVDFSDATVVCLYLLDSVNLMLRPRLQNELLPGTRIVSQTFDMGDWKPDERIRLGSVSVYKWIVPAQVAGRWQWTCSQGLDWQVELAQHHQMLSGRAWVDGSEAELLGTLLRGAMLELRIQRADDRAAREFVFRLEDEELVLLETR